MAHFANVEEFILWAMANGWTIERDVWTCEMVTYRVGNAEMGHIGNSEKRETREEANFDLRAELEREAWEHAWLNWEDLQRESE